MAAPESWSFTSGTETAADRPHARPVRDRNLARPRWCVPRSHAPWTRPRSPPPAFRLERSGRRRRCPRACPTTPASQTATLHAGGAARAPDDATRRPRRDDPGCRRRAAGRHVVELHHRAERAAGTGGHGHHARRPTPTGCPTARRSRQLRRADLDPATVEPADASRSRPTAAPRWRPRWPTTRRRARATLTPQAPLASGVRYTARSALRIRSDEPAPRWPRT